jgi:hypothetical protein
MNQPDFLKRLDHLQQQQVPFEKLFLCIPPRYKRFGNCEPDEEWLVIITKKYPWIEILRLEEDYGPASKYMGPLLLHASAVRESILIVIDDDRTYSTRMTLLYRDFFVLYPNADAATGNQELYFNLVKYQMLDEEFLDIQPSKLRYLSGFMSFALQGKKNWEGLLDYTKKILEGVPESFFHDEGILLNYIHFTDRQVYNVNFKMIDYYPEEAPDALCEGRFVQRAQIEIKIQKYTNDRGLFPQRRLVGFPRSSSALRSRNVLGS